MISLRNQKTLFNITPIFIQLRRICNSRHELVDCDTIDQDPKTDDLRTMCAWGVGLGFDYRGVYGVVSNTALYSQYYHPDPSRTGQKVVIYRQYVGNAPEKGLF